MAVLCLTQSILPSYNSVRVVRVAIVMFRANIIDPAHKDIVIYILGVLSASVTQVLQYYFGTSKSSADKNTLLDKLAEKR